MSIRKSAFVAVWFSIGAFAIPSAGLAQTPPQSPPSTPATPQKTPDKSQPAPAKKDAAPTVQITVSKSGNEPAKKAKDDDTIDYEKFVKDLKRIDGPMPLYEKGKNIYLELPEDKIGKVFLIQAAFETGLDTLFMHAGMPIGGQAVDAFKFERKDDMVWLTRPNISNRWSSSSEFAVGAERSFPEAMLNTFRVEQHNVEKGLLLVNISSLFMGEPFHLGEMISGGLGGPYQLDAIRSEPAYVKGFPENMVVQMKLHFFSPRGAEPNPLLELLGAGGNTLEDSRSAPVRVNYTMAWRKDSDYLPRVADSRIGYFTTDFFSVDKFLDEDKQQHFIDRWNLEKKDPKAALSEPVKPIIFTVDPSIPPRYRAAVKEGVLRWNKAFEGIGFKNAIQVQDPPKGDDYDHADGRYNVIRMMVGPDAPFAAISLLRTDPFSGEILNASITLDGNVLEELMEEHRRILPIAMESGNGLARAKQVLLRTPSVKIQTDKYLFETPVDEAIDAAEDRLAKFGWSHDLCNFASEMADESELAWDALAARPGGSSVNRDDFVNAYLSEAVSHEVGHCLGLRHNFEGSTLLTTAQLGDPKVTAKLGTTASVMDYTPPNAPAVLSGTGSIFMSTVGVYDQWAIKYGYSPFGAKTLDGERYPLSQIASQSGLPGHSYETDEDADQFDPSAARFDCSKDPLNFCDKQLEEFHRARRYAVDELPKPGESYAERTKIILGTILKSFNEGRIAARFVGGTFGSRNFRGDSGERPTLQPVPATSQLQAMRLITTQFLGPGAFDLPTQIMESLSLDSEKDGEGAWNAPIRDIVSSMQGNLLALVMSASTTDRVSENAFKEHGNAYTLAEHYDMLLHSICSEVGQNQKVTPLRRDLQRFFVQALIIQAGAPEGGVSNDVRLVANDCLGRLDKALASQIKQPKHLDELTTLHFKDCKGQIDRFLARRESVPG